MLRIAKAHRAEPLIMPSNPSGKHRKATKKMKTDRSFGLLKKPKFPEMYSITAFSCISKQHIMMLKKVTYMHVTTVEGVVAGLASAVMNVKTVATVTPIEVRRLIKRRFFTSGRGADEMVWGREKRSSAMVSVTRRLVQARKLAMSDVSSYRCSLLGFGQPPQHRQKPSWK